MRIAKFLVLMLFSGVLMGNLAFAQEQPASPPAIEDQAKTAVEPGGGHPGVHGAAAEGAEAEGEPRGTFDPHAGTWFNWLARPFAGIVSGKSMGAPEFEEHNGEHHVVDIRSIRYDYIVLALGVMALLGLAATRAAKQAKVRPEGKPHSLSNAIEAAVEGFREYLIGIMGYDLAVKYAPLIASFFFTILLMNWLGLIPGLMSPTANPNIPISLALVAFVCVHVIAIKEAGVKSWFMHFVGEPLWLAPLNLPLHLIGELIKPLSLAMRLLCNVFGEEMVITTLTALSLSVLPIWLPIPFQLPMLFLGTFFGFLQALVFSTLLAIYISIFANHHDDHDEHNTHGHVEHTTQNGHNIVVAHASEISLA